ncbi:MAG: YihY/virulence factor BrkB family protein [Bryobacteraceae bacterium]|nr:YihY/virulence factor BrkB family protein [Bryobacteraceae bacterium]
MGDESKPQTPGIPHGVTESPRTSLHALPRMIAQASREWINDNVPRLGAAVAFYALLSLAPMVVMTVALAALVYGQDAVQGRLALQIDGIAGPEVARMVQGIIRGAYQPQTGAIATVFGLLTLIFAASSLFLELRDAMNTIWGVPFPTDHSHVATVIRLVRERFYSFAVVTGLGFMLLVALLLNASIVAMRIAAPPAATFLILYLLAAALFAALYKVLPDVTLKWNDVVLGAMIAALLFVLGKQLMGVYFARADFGSIYGAAGSPIVVLLWVYYSAQLFFWGAEFSKAYAKTLGSHRAQKF